MKKTMIGFLILFGLLACNKRVEKKNVIAMVGDESLSLDELMDEIPPQVRGNVSKVEIREFVMNWINRQVLYQEALQRKLDEREDVQRAFDRLKKEVLVTQLTDETLDSEVSVTDDEIAAYYESSKDAFTLEHAIVHAHHILLPEDQLAVAREVQRRLRNGEDAEIIYNEVTLDSINAWDWDWGYFSESEIENLIPDLANQVFRLRAGQVTPPIESEYGYHVLKIIDKQEKGELQSLEQVKDEIRLKLETKKKNDRYQRFLLQVKSKFSIKTNFELLRMSPFTDSLVAAGGTR